MPAARCSIDGLNFPVSYAGTTCPVCQDQILEGIQNDVPDDPDELKKVVNNAAFKRYLEDHDRA